VRESAISARFSGGRLGAVRFIPAAGAGLDYGCVDFLRPHRSTVSIQDIETSSPFNGQAACRALLTSLAPGKIHFFDCLTFGRAFVAASNT
jgi:hypothetical protein